LGEVLKEMREEQGMKQEALAKLLGKRSQTFVSKVEQGKRRLGLLEFCEYAEALGVDAVQLLELFLGRQ
jgi:transcriptional regulator with XRE-family HTH domain